MEEERFILLIQKELMGQLSETEEVELMAWKDTSPENQEMYKQVVTAWQVSTEYGQDLEIDSEADFATVWTRIDSENGKIIRPNFIRWSMISASILLIISMFFLMQQSPAVELTAPTDNYEHLLPDGSTLMLAQGSQLTYREDFTEIRHLTIDGALYAQITHDPALPLTILSQNLVTRVLGTTFYLKDKEGEIPSVGLVAGSVSVQSRNTGTIELLVPGQHVTLKDKKLEVAEGSVREGFEWHEVLLQFEEVSLQEVATRLSARFDTRIVLEGDMAACTFTGRFTDQSLEEILNSIVTLYGAQLSPNQIGYTLSGGACE